jgi:hypothetical protein
VVFSRLPESTTPQQEIGPCLLRQVSQGLLTFLFLALEAAGVKIERSSKLLSSANCPTLQFGITNASRGSESRFARWRGNIADHVNESLRMLLEILLDECGEHLDVDRLGNVAVATGF